MSVIVISGSRYWKDDKYNIVKEELKKYPNSFIIVGDCKGVDSLAVRAAKELGYKYQIFYANWSKYGNSAGPKRNNEMIIELQKRNETNKFVLSFHDKLSESKGTINLMTNAQTNGIAIYHHDGKTSKKWTKWIKPISLKKSIGKKK